MDVTRCIERYASFLLFRYSELFIREFLRMKWHCWHDYRTDILHDKAPSSPMLRWNAVFLISATVNILAMIFWEAIMRSENRRET